MGCSIVGSFLSSPFSLVLVWFIPPFTLADFPSFPSLSSSSWWEEFWVWLGGTCCRRATCVWLLHPCCVRVEGPTGFSSWVWWFGGLGLGWTGLGPGFGSLVWLACLRVIPPLLLPPFLFWLAWIICGFWFRCMNRVDDGGWVLVLDYHYTPHDWRRWMIARSWGSRAEHVG